MVSPKKDRVAQRIRLFLASANDVTTEHWEVGRNGASRRSRLIDRIHYLIGR